MTASDIAAVVSRATGIPVHDMVRGEKQKLLHLEGRLLAWYKHQIHSAHMLHSQRRCPSGSWGRAGPSAPWPMR